MKVAFLDRDGTIIKDYEDEKWKFIKEPEFIEGAFEALREIRNRGYEIVIITNQYLINEGIISIEQYREFACRFIDTLKKNEISILDIFFCPHSRSESCSCMKPKQGLVEMALDKYSEIDMSESFFAGDSLCDVQLGKSLGIKTFGIGIDNKEFSYISVDSLLGCMKYI